MSDIVVQRFIHTAQTVRGGRVMYRQARVTTGGVPGLSMHEATSTGSIAAGEKPEGILINVGIDESIAAGDVVGGYGGTLAVARSGIWTCCAGEAMDPATVRDVSWDNQGRIRAGVRGVDFIIGELVGARNVTAAGEPCEVHINIDTGN